MIIAIMPGCFEQYCSISSGLMTIKAVERASAVAASGAEDQAAILSFTGCLRRGSMICCPFFRPELLMARRAKKGRARICLRLFGLLKVRGQPFVSGGLSRARTE